MRCIAPRVIAMLPYQDIDASNPAYDPLTWFNVVGALGCVLWIVAYVLMVLAAQRDRTYALPMLAICLNFAWEALASFLWPNPVALWRFFDKAWLGFDVLLVWQLWRYGPKEMTIPEVRKHFHAIVVALFVAALVAQHTFVMSYFDRLGLTVAFLINLVMSALFIPFFFARRDDRRGLSLPAAWCKMLGTLGTSIECQVLIAAIDPELPSLAFLTFVQVAIFVLDLVYVLLLTFVGPGPDGRRSRAVRLPRHGHVA